MQIDGRKISEFIDKQVKKDAKKLGKKSNPLLTVFLVGTSDDQLSFVKIKSKIAAKIGVDYHLVHLKATPNFIALAKKIKEEVDKVEVKASSSNNRFRPNFRPTVSTTISRPKKRLRDTAENRSSIRRSDWLS